MKNPEDATKKPIRRYKQIQQSYTVHEGYNSNTRKSVPFLYTSKMDPGVNVNVHQQRNKEGVVYRQWYTMEFYSVIKKNEIMPLAATWMDLEIAVPSEGSQTQKDKYHMIWLICGILKKKKEGYKWIYSQNRNKVTDIENKFMVTRA